MEKRSYLGYRAKASNITKLAKFTGASNIQDKLPSAKPLKLNKKKNGK